MNKKIFIVLLSTIMSLNSIMAADAAIAETKQAHVGVYAQSAQDSSIQKKLAQLEASSGGRIGLAALDTTNNNLFQYHANERFPTGCTSKVIGVATILKQSMTNRSLLEEKITYTKKDLVNWNPVTEKHLNDGMTVNQLCAAAIEYSDNTAMNLLVKKMSGLQAMNAFARSIGDHSFRQDHDWPDEALSGKPSDQNDSSTPDAMLKSLQKLALGDTLAPYQRELLVTWLKNNTTGNARIRAGVPKGWVVGDKTGTGYNYGITNDVAIIWPPKCAPIVLVIYYKNNIKDAPKREDVLAEATTSVLKEFAKKNQCIKVSAVER